MFLLHFPSGHPALPLAGTLARWCSDFPPPFRPLFRHPGKPGLRGPYRRRLPVHLARPQHRPMVKRWGDWNRAPAAVSF